MKGRDKRKKAKAKRELRKLNTTVTVAPVLSYMIKKAA